MMALGEVRAVIAWGRMASRVESINKFTDHRVATACCFAGRMASVRSAAVLEKVLEKCWTGGDCGRLLLLPLLSGCAGTMVT